MMIALRGKLERVRIEGKDKPSAPALQQPSSSTDTTATAAASAELSSTATTTETKPGTKSPEPGTSASDATKGVTSTSTTETNIAASAAPSTLPSSSSPSFQWKWTGQWAFGTAITEADVAASKAATSTGAAVAAASSSELSMMAMPGNTKKLFPFSYTWESAVDPFDVPVPSEEILYKEAKEKLEQQQQQQQQQQTAAATEQQPQKQQTAPAVAATNPIAIGAAGLSAPVPGTKQETVSAVKQESAASGNTNTTTDNQTQPDNSSGDSKKPELATATSTTEAATTDEKNNPSEPLQSSTPASKLPAVSTFADDGFSDASTQYPDQCPTGGRWKGSFHTVAPGRRSSVLATAQPIPTIPVSESFCLFLNATPPKDARIHFLDEKEEEKKKASGISSSSTTTMSSILRNDLSKLPETGHIHARGTGENQYGVFELIGSLQLDTGILQLQRLYVQIPDSHRKRNPSPRGTRRRTVRLAAAAAAASASSANTGATAASAPDSTPRGTRKRQLSWKRRASMEEIVDTPLGTVSSSKAVSSSNKRQRKRASGIDGNSPGISPTSAQAGSVEPMELDGGQSSSAAGVASIVDPSSATTQTRWPNAPPLSIPGGGAGGKGSRKASTTLNAPGRGAGALTTAAASGLKLPQTGDPVKARWRAAHFLYYHKPNPVEDPSTAAATTSGGSFVAGAGGAATSTTSSSNAALLPKSVVYEGEMYNGQRHGRGVSLYDNSFIYEGEWQFDKEHGLGSLFTSDRKHIVYEGEWERGKMQGRGKYYYCDFDGAKKDAAQQGSSKKKKGPAVTSDEPHDKEEVIRGKVFYDGEFRENLRHGSGIYVLPDGSVYEGSWANGNMNGRGIFRWSDGSVYDGEWKDNKRHGSGVLTASDGFTYDGNWVQSCMEGRGSATYPSGKQYHGMWLNGKREGRGTILFPNGAVYEGRFRDDAIDGQGTMKIRRAVVVPREEGEKADFMIPVSFQSDMGHIHRKAGFTVGGK